MNDWICQHKGWWTHEKFGGVCRERDGWYCYHKVGFSYVTSFDGTKGPHKTMKRAMEACGEEYRRTQ
jgi:hypothetical protein